MALFSSLGTSDAANGQRRYKPLDDTTKTLNAIPAPPPATATLAAQNAALAQTAADLARKRAAAGNTLLNGAPMGTPANSAAAVLQPRTLLGY